MTDMLAPALPARVFYSVAEAAQLFRLSEMTLYRAINAGEFPAVRVRGRLVVPARAVDELAEAAMDAGTLVDASTWRPDGAAGPAVGEDAR